MAAQQLGDKPTPPPRVRRLDSLRNVRLEAAGLYAAARRGEIPAGDASKLASVLGLVAAILRDAELEGRVKRLEEAEGAG